MPSVHQKPLDASYSKWDKYDPDVEEMKLDNKEKVEKLQVQKKNNILSPNSESLTLNGTSSKFQDRVKYMKNFVDLLSNGEYKQILILTVL